MDFILCIVNVGIIGLVKTRDRSVSASADIVMKTSSSKLVDTSIPIGNNLGLRREPDVYMKIVRQLNLR